MNSQDSLLPKVGNETQPQDAGAPTRAPLEPSITTSHDVGSPSMGGAEVASASDPSAELVARLPKIVHFRELCRCGDEVWIENDGQLYRLRRTRQGKLILTK